MLKMATWQNTNSPKFAQNLVHIVIFLLVRSLDENLNFHWIKMWGSTLNRFWAFFLNSSCASLVLIKEKFDEFYERNSDKISLNSKRSNTLFWGHFILNLKSPDMHFYKNKWNNSLSVQGKRMMDCSVLILP